ncbi:MAG: UDP-N-acetylglucosamine 1-carboxyvinyltransferase [Candidatus Neomarinimicrobiota bacterium]
MDKIFIDGGKQLAGSVDISGAKNAVLPIMASALIANGKSVISRVPKLRDTYTMIRLMEIIGAKCSFKDDILTVDGTSVNNPEAPYDLVKTMRASFYVLGPLIARFGYVKVSLPGGCAWGPRPVDLHLKALEKLGAKITLKSGYIIAEADKLIGNTIDLDFPSVGATGNILMAAVTAEGTTTINNAAREPEIDQVCKYLISMGAKIKGGGSSKIIIHGVEKLHSANVEIIPDRIEAGTFLAAGAILGTITLNKLNPKHLVSVINNFKEIGCEIKTTQDSITISPTDIIKPFNLKAEVYPGFPTDLQAQWMAIMILAKGSCKVTDMVYYDRFSHIPELNRFGANIRLNKNTAYIDGVKILKAAPVMSTDIRASASLIIAGLAAEGVTEVSRIYHIDRGYEKIENKFKLLGADIWRENRL